MFGGAAGCLKWCSPTDCVGLLSICRRTVCVGVTGEASVSIYMQPVCHVFSGEAGSCG